ncbi:Ig-like domain-containing protein [Cellulosimicrobium cellulans]|uniref:RCC1 domain-containing protein n=1 Tax=Cellulosimicrobium cellulans TaxID=1710 RepID=UPI00130DE3D7|nr:Ig-like domain-containing protein [Cellulosimicrobium cellulans]
MTPARTVPPAAAPGRVGRRPARPGLARRLVAVAAVALAVGVPVSAAAAPPSPDAGSTAGGAVVELEVPGSTYADVWAGASSSFAVTSDGRLWAAGSGTAGQLGDGASADRATRVPVGGLPGGVTQVAGGQRHTLAVAGDGSLWSWGDGSSGQLGHGSSAGRDVPGQVYLVDVPVVSVAAGAEFSLAVTEDGRTWAWGENDEAQLGWPAQVGVSLPVRVGGLADTPRSVAVAAGTAHGLALREDGTVWAWGRGELGQLGDGARTSSSTPVQVTGWGARRIVAVSAGADHSAAVAEDGTLWIWGSGGWGQLGDGALGGVAAVPQQVPGLADVRVAEAALSATATVVRSTDGEVWSWGSGAALGDPARPLASAPARVPLPGPARALASEGEHAEVVLDDGTLWTWGSGTAGATSDGAGADSAVPTRVRAPLAVIAVSFGAVAATDVTVVDDRRVRATAPAQAAGAVAVRLATVLRDGVTAGPDLALDAAFTYVEPPAAPRDVVASAVRVTARATPGSTVAVRDAGGASLGSAVAGADGGVVVGLDPAPLDGQVLTVAAAVRGVAGPGTPVTVDAVAPAPPVLRPTDGRALTGTAEPGALLRVRRDDGALAGTTTVAADGTWSVGLAPAAVAGDRLDVDAQDGAGNTSTAVRWRVGLPGVTAAALVAGRGGSLGAGGFQPGELVRVTLGGADLGTVPADAEGSVAVPATVAEVPPGGSLALVLRGELSGVLTGDVAVTAPGSVPGAGPGTGLAPGPGSAPGSAPSSGAGPGTAATTAGDSGARAARPSAGLAATGTAVLAAVALAGAAGAVGVALVVWSGRGRASARRRVHPAG